MTVQRIIRSVVGALVLTIAAAFAQGLSAQFRTAQSPEEVGLSAERLDRLSRVTQAHVDSGLLPGAVLLVSRGGKIAYWKSIGYRDRATNSPMSNDAIFRIASMTKPIVSVAVMILQ